MPRSLLLTVAFVLSCACATTPKESQKGSRWSAYPTVPTGVPLAQDSSSKNSEKYICTMEMEVGSHIPERVCRPITLSAALAAKQKQDETQNQLLQLETEQLKMRLLNPKGAGN